MPTPIRLLALALCLTLTLGLLAGCGSTNQSPRNTAATPAISGPELPALRPTADATPTNGTTDPGTRYMNDITPFGAIAVETDPLVDPRAVVYHRELEFESPAAAPMGNGFPAPTSPAQPAPAERPAAPAIGGPPAGPARQNPWTTPEGTN